MAGDRRGDPVYPGPVHSDEEELPQGIRGPELLLEVRKRLQSENRWRGKVE
ncbi:hypothetical protein GF326_10990 [Candidatus Bathyarchaeota archaeon]|nr:hypothetical protein [Candidatus Bathyarchaeota archaeon]